MECEKGRRGRGKGNKLVGWDERTTLIRIQMDFLIEANVGEN